MNTKERINTLVNFLNTLKENGRTTVHLTPLLKTLEDIQHSSATEPASTPQEKADKQAEIKAQFDLAYYNAQTASNMAYYDAVRESQMAMFKSVMKYGEATIKACLTINGAAALAVLTFLGHLFTIPEERSLIAKFSVVLPKFIWGVFLAPAAFGFTYFTQKAYKNKYKKIGHAGTAVVVIMVIASLIAFARGCMQAFSLLSSVKF